MRSLLIATSCWLLLITSASAADSDKDISGEWVIRFPSGASKKIKLVALGKNRYRFEPIGLTMGGIYELKDGKLVITEPSDKRLTGFEWEVSKDGLKLVGQPEIGKTGSDYLGATLRRAEPKDTPKAENNPARADAAPAGKCRVTVAVVSTEYRKMGGTLDRGIAFVYKGDSRLSENYSKEGRFALDLPPGDYTLDLSGNGSSGATFVPSSKKFTIKPDDAKLDLGTIDLPASKITKLFGRPAPELDGAVAWKNSDPLTLNGLRGQVVVIDFWNYACTICHQHKPDLVALADKYKGKGVKVITIHDGTAESIADMNEKMKPIVERAWKGKDLTLPVALDRKGPKGIFQSFGIFAVPAVVLIDQEGKVVRRFHHAGDPELSAQVAKLLEKGK